MQWCAKSATLQHLLLHSSMNNANMAFRWKHLFSSLASPHESRPPSPNILRPTPPPPRPVSLLWKLSEPKNFLRLLHRHEKLNPAKRYGSPHHMASHPLPRFTHRSSFRTLGWNKKKLISCHSLFPSLHNALLERYRYLYLRRTIYGDEETHRMLLTIMFSPSIHYMNGQDIRKFSVALWITRKMELWRTEKKENNARMRRWWSPLKVVGFFLKSFVVAHLSWLPVGLHASKVWYTYWNMGQASGSF